MLSRLKVLWLVAVAIAAFGSTSVWAQTSAPVSGRVEVLKADGTREPVPNAQIDVYRTDINSGFPSSKTNKKGEFYFAGLLLGAEFAFSVSAPNMAPFIYPGVKGGRENIVITLSPGDGKKLTEAEVRAELASGGNKGGGDGGDKAQAEANQKAQADLEKKNAEIIAKNKQIEEGDAIARKSGEEGFAALKADNLDVAIAKFGEGVAAVPDFVGSTPILLNGRMNAYKMKGFKMYREGAASADIAVRKTKYDESNRLFELGLADFKQAIQIIAAAAPAANANETAQRAQLKLNLYAAATEIHRLKAVTGIDATKIDEAKGVMTEYAAMETDPAKKLQVQLTMGDMFRTSGDFAKAIAAYREVLAVKPDHPEAMGSLGLSLFAEGAAQVPEDKEKEQEGLNYMQKYVEMAPIQPTDSNAVKELKTSVKETVEYLKAQKMTPQKAPGKKRS